MTEQAKYTLEDANQYFAIACNNRIWKLLEQKEHTEDEKMRKSSTWLMRLCCIGAKVRIVRK